MFGINNPQAVSQNDAAVDGYGQGLPVGGNDLLPSENISAADDSLSPTSRGISTIPDNTNQNARPISDEAASLDSSDDLIEIKKNALQQLTPLVGQLDQTPEEKFRTTMMLIQATDDKSLLKSAYQSALQIPDEKSKAQALLDVVNEINYFTHPDVQ